MKKYFFLFLLLISQLSVFSQNENRTFISVNFQDDVLKISVNDGFYLIKFYNTNIVETTFLPKNEDLISNSQAVVLQTNDADAKFNESLNAIDFSSKGILVNIQKKPFKISYIYKGEEITSEKLQNLLLVVSLPMTCQMLKV